MEEQPKRFRIRENSVFRLPQSVQRNIMICLFVHNALVPAFATRFAISRLLVATKTRVKRVVSSVLIQWNSSDHHEDVEASISIYKRE